MNDLTVFTADWRINPATLLLLLGLVVIWHGFFGSPRARYGLLRPRAGAVRRAEGWRRFLAGLTIVGLALAWFETSRTLLFLSLGIGFVEMVEATAVLSTMHHAQKHRISAAYPTRPL